MKILVANLYLDDQLAQEFEEEMARVMVLPDKAVEITSVRPKNDPLIKLPEGAENFSRLLLSGSEASVMTENPWDEALMALFKAFVEADKPVLGICHGHQFIIRALVGRNHVRKRAERVWGWLDMDLAASLITKDLGRITSAICNSEEVFDLPGEFRVLAGAGHCGVLAFEHRKKPIWGVQFHPEYGKEYGQAVMDFSAEDQAPGSFEFLDQRRGESPLAPNPILFRNFLQA